jgi:SAM-dependent methyltransferase
MLEHAERPWRVVAEMARVVRPGGLILLTARGWVVTRRWTESNGVEVGEVATFGYHNPPDLWRYSDGAMRALAEDAGLVVDEIMQDPQAPGWFLAARRP